MKRYSNQASYVYSCKIEFRKQKIYSLNGYAIREPDYLAKNLQFSKIVFVILAFDAKSNLTKTKRKQPKNQAKEKAYRTTGLHCMRCIHKIKFAKQSHQPSTMLIA